jgi:hypothetical protein
MGSAPPNSPEQSLNRPKGDLNLLLIVSAWARLPTAGRLRVRILGQPLIKVLD